MSQSTAWLLLVSALTLATVSGQDYCDKSLCNGATHIACDNDNAWGSKCPSNAELINIDADLQNVLLKAHNDKRNLVAGGGVPHLSRACRMATITWNDELAQLAALNVRQCAMKHDACRNTATYKYSGQNLAWLTYFEPLNVASLLEQSVQMWYDEVANAKQSHIDAYPTNYNGPTIGHFTVMVADKNVQVGCAAATYSVPGKSYKAFLMACNYATTNMVGKRLYASCSTAASECTTSVSPSYPSLCSTLEQFAVNTFN